MPSSPYTPCLHAQNGVNDLGERWFGLHRSEKEYISWLRFLAIAAGAESETDAVDWHVKS